MTYELRPLTAEQGEAMANWAYPGPWAVYDVSVPLDPEEGFWAVVDDAGEVAGYACFGVEARVPGLEERRGVLDVGVGMRPDLTGQGLGRAFAGAVLDHAREVTGASRMRAVVQDWNQRSRRLLAGLGFEETGDHRVGELRYVVYERSADGEQAWS
ncbi:MAG: GNAT family N-acetyltransferase [Spirochaetaceae bacterium]|nr:GNAT family N-acetyltransferase [Spirochaetaceae bacterium]